MPLLTKSQLGMVSIVFLMRNVGYPNTQHPAPLSVAVQHRLGPYFTGVAIGQADFQHLEFSRVAKIETGEIDLGKILAHGTNQVDTADASVRASLIQGFQGASPAGKFIAENWDATNLKHMSLTSVGIAIGHSCACQHCNMPDLSIWI